MATLLSQSMMRSLGELRYEPTQKRVRALSAGQAVFDSRRALIVWEPKRVVPSYAVPEDDIQVPCLRAEASDAQEHPVVLGPGGPPVLDPRTAFTVHTCAGEPLSLQVGAGELTGAGFRPADPDLAGYVILDFDAFDEWLEEDETIIGHPRDPFSRIDIRRGSSQVQIEVDGVLVADTTSARLLFETMITPRFYLPRGDVRMDLLSPSRTRTTCAYKGHASYWSVEVGGKTHPDLAWSYEDPLPDALQIKDHVAFHDEHADVVLDGERRERPLTPWS